MVQKEVNITEKLMKRLMTFKGKYLRNSWEISDCGRSNKRWWALSLISKTWIQELRNFSRQNHMPFGFLLFKLKPKLFSFISVCTTIAEARSSPIREKCLTCRCGWRVHHRPSAGERASWSALYNLLGKATMSIEKKLGKFYCWFF